MTEQLVAPPASENKTEDAHASEESVNGAEKPATAANSKAQDEKKEKERSFSINSTRQFPNWLREHNASIAFTTYQAGKVLTISPRPQKGIQIGHENYKRCLGMWSDGKSIWMTALFQLWRFEDFLPPGQAEAKHDKVFVPTVGYTTGDIDVHDIGVDADGQVVFVNTLFSCLATVDARHSFVPLWKPPFVSRLAAEDRCHLNGLAMENGRAAYVTAVSRTDTNEGWRDNRASGGVVVDVRTNDIVCEGLSMPHSPRVYRDKLWVLNSGAGYFGYVDRQTGKFEQVAFCTGYARGLAFLGDFAIIGLSLARHNKVFGGLPLQDELEKRQVEPRCGIQVIDLRTGDCVHSMRIEGAVTELYDVVALPGTVRPLLHGFSNDHIHRIISVGKPSRKIDEPLSV
jgi:uncharacterized protein (TIGR03032 family)